MAKAKIYFRPEMFVSTEHYTASQKAEFCNRLANFLVGGCQRGLFTRILYQQLSNCFGHIAHFNIDGFYETWFSRPERRVAFIRHTLEHSPMGDPKYTYVDAEREFKKWLKTSGLIEQYQQNADTHQSYESVKSIAHTMLKLGGLSVTAAKVEVEVAAARKRVEEQTGTLDDNFIKPIVASLTREFCQNTETFILASVSENANSFGLHGFIFISRTGEAWQCAASRHGTAYERGDKVTVTLRAGVPEWHKLGFEIPERLERTAPAGVVRELWGD